MPRTASTLLILLIGCLAIGSSPASAARKMSAITYLNANSEREIMVFRIGEEEDGNLYARHFVGGQWIWVPHGHPPGVFRLSNPTALTYVDANGNRRVYVFLQSTDNKLWLRYFNGFTWQWQSRGGPDLIDNSMSAITYKDDAGNQRLYAFAQTKIGTQINLVTHYWNGAEWQWVTNGTVFGPESPTVSVTYPDTEGNRHIDVFFTGGANSGLYSFSWNGSGWSWINHGHDGVVPAAVTTYLDEDGQRRVYLFVKEGNTLAARYNGGAAWAWRYLETVPATSPLADVTVAPFTDTLGLKRMMVFIQKGGALAHSSWNGLFWSPSQPNTSVTANFPRAISYRDSREEPDHITVFMSCLPTGDNLCSNSTTTGAWQFMNHGPAQ